MLWTYFPCCDLLYRASLGQVVWCSQVVCSHLLRIVYRGRETFLRAFDAFPSVVCVCVTVYEPTVTCVLYVCISGDLVLVVSQYPFRVDLLYSQSSPTYWFLRIFAILIVVRFLVRWCDLCVCHRIWSKILNLMFCFMNEYLKIWLYLDSKVLEIMLENFFPLVAHLVTNSLLSLLEMKSIENCFKLMLVGRS